VDFALSGGEDFELVFTLSPRSAGPIIDAIADQTGTPVFIVGKILPAKEGIVQVSSGGVRRPLRAKGYRHF
jgi:thiamine monophosphate kinase